MVSENKDEEIEDLFTSEDFIKHVLNDKPEGVPNGKANSLIIKQKGKHYDKALLAKIFYEKVMKGGITISADTKANIKNLLDKINTLLFK
jgi:hypothetical protein